MRTPWPSRSAPQSCTASQIDGSPNASPAWMVMWKFSAATSWNASRWRVGGLPASLPAMSKPTTPASRWRTASSAISVEWAAWRMAVRIVPRVREVPAAPSAEALDHRLHHLVEREAGAQVLLRREAHLGVDDAVGGQVLRALLGDPHRARPSSA